MAVLSIDLGSSHTVAVLRDDAGRRRLLLFDGSPLLPSGVLAGADGALHVGRDAMLSARSEPARFEPHPKRRIDDGAVLLGDGAVPVVELFAAVLRRVADEARRTAGTVPPVVLTHPVAWGATRRATLTDAAVRAGLTVAALVAEPIAAGCYFTGVLGSALPAGRALAVFDFGGGTLDVAVVRRGDAGLTVVGTGGLDDVGGADLDAAVIVQLGRSLGGTDAWQRLATPPDAAAQRDRAALWQDVRAAKEMLSRATTAPVQVPGAPSASHLTRQEFELAVAPLLTRAVQETAATLRRAGLRADQLAGVFLVGGSSRIPMVAQLLHRQLGIAPTVLEQPETAVAEGAPYAVGGSPVSDRVDAALAALNRPAPGPRVAAPAGTPGIAAAATDPAAIRAARRRRYLVAATVGVVVALLASLALFRPWERREPARADQHTSASASPTSDPCPTNAQILAAARKVKDRNQKPVFVKSQSVSKGPDCADGFAYLVLQALYDTGQYDGADVVLQDKGGTWTVVAYAGVCDPGWTWQKHASKRFIHLAGCDRPAGGG